MNYFTKTIVLRTNSRDFRITWRQNVRFEMGTKVRDLENFRYNHNGRKAFEKTRRDQIIA